MQRQSGWIKSEHLKTGRVASDLDMELSEGLLWTGAGSVSIDIEIDTGQQSSLWALDSVDSPAGGWRPTRYERDRGFGCCESRSFDPGILGWK